MLAWTDILYDKESASRHGSRRRAMSRDVDDGIHRPGEENVAKPIHIGCIKPHYRLHRNLGPVEKDIA